MKKRCRFAAGICLVTVACFCVGCTNIQARQDGKTENEVIEVLPRPENVECKVAPVAGEELSPDGRWLLRQTGARPGVTADGTYAPDAVQIVDAVTQEVVWEGIADHRQSVLWSPDSSYLAMTRTAHGYGYITVIQTADWQDWDFTPPEGSNIPAYTFLPDTDWGEWIKNDQLRLTIGRDSDTAPQTSYRCLLECTEEGLGATVLEQTTDRLSDAYDFDHNGISETVELVTVFDSTGTGHISWLELWVRDQNNNCLWKDEAGTAHVGWNSIFALAIDGQDYLLRYSPYIGMGFGDYHYWLFSLDENGEVMYEECAVEFDLNFYSQNHQGFDSESLGRFLTDVHAYLDGSELLLTTEKGEFRSGGSGAEFRDDLDFWDDNLPYDKFLTPEENLQNYKDYMTELWAADAQADETVRIE